MIRIKKGLDLPISGQPEQKIAEEVSVNTVALVGPDYVGMKPTMAVKEGDSVRLGQLLFTDKKNPAVRYTSPGCGTVKAIHRGEKRVFLSVVIELSGNEAERFEQYSEADCQGLGRDKVVHNIVQSGLWPSFRTRPFSLVPAPDSQPHSIFINAMDTEPLSPSPEIVIKDAEADFICGARLVSRLTEGKTYLSHGEKTQLPLENLGFLECEGFIGPHPAGLVGTHIHFIDPVHRGKTVWHIGYQDVIAIGRLFKTGQLPVERVVSLAGSEVKHPRLVRTRVGASLTELVESSLKGGPHRRISGSVLHGRAGDGPLDFLGKYHRQVSVIQEGTEREFLGWQKPGFDKFSTIPVFLSSLIPKKRFPFSTSTEGSKRAMVPIGMYEKVMPLDIIPTFLLRSLVVGDTEQAQALGCLELDEEDLALCTFVDPGKTSYGPILRKNLTIIEKEG